MRGFLDNLIQNVGGSIAGALQMGVNRLGRGDQRVGGNGMGGASGVYQPKVGKAYASDERGLTIPNEMLPGNQELLSPMGSPIPTPQPSAQPEQVLGASDYRPQSFEDIKAMIDRGMARGFGNSPMATMSGEMAMTGKRLADSTQGKIDPLMAAIVALKESGGGRDTSTPEANNPYNIMLGGRAVKYPNLDIATRGGMGQRGFEGLLRAGGPYDKFRQTGDLGDFYGSYTPVSDPLNPGVGDQIETHNKLRRLFTGE